MKNKKKVKLEEIFPKDKVVLKITKYYVPHRHPTELEIRLFDLMGYKKSEKSFSLAQMATKLGCNILKVSKLLWILYNKKLISIQNNKDGSIECYASRFSRTRKAWDSDDDEDTRSILEFE